MAPPAHHLHPSAAAPFGFANGQLEALKWIALASMFVDHFGRHLMGHPQDGWVFALGRIAFPLFVLVLGVNLARAGGQASRAARTALRLAVWCAVAVLPSVWARGEPLTVNVLGTLALGAALCWALASAGPVLLRIAAGVGVAGASQYVEFGPAGVFMVPAVYLYCSGRQPGLAVVAAALLLATAWLNASFGGWPAYAATLACLPLAGLVRGLPLSLPRWQPLFYLIYPLHLALIGALKGQAVPGFGLTL